MLFINVFGALICCGFYTALANAVSISSDAALKVPVNNVPENNARHPTQLAAAPIGAPISRVIWKVTCDSFHVGNECSKAIDGNKNTFWHTQYSTSSNPPPPHTITVDLGSTQNVNGISMLPRQDGVTNGRIARHSVFLSSDGITWGSPVAYGTWYGDATLKYSNFETKPARYVRLVAITEVNGKPWTSIADLNVYRASSYTPPAKGIGMWGATIDFPIVPVAAAVEPTSGKVIVWSAYRYDQFTKSPGSYTLTSEWNPATGIISQRTVSNTDHDMFCPGISMDGNGQIVVTGGNSAKKTTLFDSGSDSWIAGPDMKVPRGYQSSATTSDGRVFTIGGSWSGGVSVKNGEIYDPEAKSWTLLSGAEVNPMLTKDKQGRYRSDNHGWLFGWKNNTVFQAGPSSAMNWYYTEGNGDVKPAGVRKSSRGVDPDAMCGGSVMYDAVNGKILTFGGSTSYQSASATTNAHIITIGKPGDAAQVSFASQGMFHARIFHTSVVLPDGSVFIAGGQSYGVPFADSTVQLTPEVYIPSKGRFFLQQRNSIPRVYHSISLLLPDATVLNGGGGLCGSCTTNHFDAQIFTPPYLYDANGNLAKRPSIQAIAATTLKVGRTMSLRTDSAISSASLVRYGTSTHTVNTDQRRIPVALKKRDTNLYSFVIPADPGIALPGYWMLFVMNQAGVPSVAKTIKITLE
ncbi:galactose oxidase precursor [Dactylonectria macrodidyma]|uniref:Galactose oxidase n=1 Tax=Dactylonectria macrodidyma TaxID=307937 RepID=A0A9P9FNI2_9HYPO|nr:galactose oxidase precursor [Dactylonectria macrodidyma]